ncbi:hypothetical protein VTN02DRAFT_279 [Thermoascus thermophilus]
MSVSGGPQSFDARRDPLTIDGVEKNSFCVESFDEGRPSVRRVCQEAFGRALLSSRRTAQHTVSAVVFRVAGVLRDRPCPVSQLPRALEDGRVAPVVPGVLRAHSHPLADPIQARLELQGGEERQATTGPLLTDVSLRLERGRPVDGPAPSPGGTGEDRHGAIVVDGGTPVLKHMHGALVLTHREAARREVIGLFDHDHAVSRLGNVLGCHAAAAATPDDHDIRLDRLGLVTGRKLEESILEAGCRPAVHRDPWKAEDGEERGTGDDPCPFGHRRHGPVDGA